MLPFPSHSWLTFETHFVSIFKNIIPFLDQKEEKQKKKRNKQYFPFPAIKLTKHDSRPAALRPLSDVANPTGHLLSLFETPSEMLSEMLSGMLSGLLG